MGSEEFARGRRSVKMDCGSRFSANVGDLQSTRTADAVETGTQHRRSVTQRVGPSKPPAGAGLLDGRSERLANAGRGNSFRFFIEDQSLNVVSNVPAVENVCDIGNLDHQNAAPIAP